MMHDSLKVLDAFLDRPVSYFKIFSKITGSVTSGVLLSQIVYWDKAMNHKEFWKTDSEFCEELSMGTKELKNAKIKVSPFVMISRKGVPAKTYYKLDREALINSITSYDETEQLVMPKGTNQLCPNGTTGYAERAQQVYGTESTTESTTENTETTETGILEKIESSFSLKTETPVPEVVNIPPAQKSPLEEKIGEFVEFRKAIKHPINPTSQNSFLKKLQKLSGGDHEIAIDILDESIANGWQGIFALPQNVHHKQNLVC